MHPDNEEVVGVLREVKDEIKTLQNVKIQGARVKARITWLDQGDKSFKFFFHLLRNKQAKEHIDRICKIGVDITNQERLLMDSRNYYQNLFTSEDRGCDKEEAR